MLKGFMIVIGALLAGSLVLLLAVAWIEIRQARQLQNQRPHTEPAAGSASVAVVYFSRSGSTALAARHVATRLHAQLFPLDAPEYELGVAGLTEALKDANALKSASESLPTIHPQTLDLSPFETVWLGSPIWLYSPAPPIWAFVENNRFDGQKVVLFNTFNSHIGEDHIARFRELVMARGALSFEHRRVLRGRMTQQLSPEDMLQVIDAEWFPKTQESLPSSPAVP